MKPTTEDVLKWAREAGFYPENAPAMNPILEKLATLAYAAGAAAEREECAKVCDHTQDKSLMTRFYGASNEYREGRAMGANLCAIAIRARREKNE